MFMTLCLQTYPNLKYVGQITWFISQSMEFYSYLCSFNNKEIE